jgi:hydroxymethylpyrimidine pyrophosphatase-like HAD family hydrolase
MKNYKLFLCLGAIFFLMSGSCQRNNQLLETSGANGSRIPSDALISVSESETLGQWFTLFISANGEVVYTPTKYTGYNRENLPPQGVPIKSRINREQLEEIIREFENQKFFSLDDSYNCGYAPDGAVRTVSIEIGGKKKSVHWRKCNKDGKDFPPEFFAVFDKINEVRNRKQ